MKRLLLFLIICLLSNLFIFADDSDFDYVFQKIAEKLSEAAGKIENKTVAVYGFETIGRADDSFARYATEKLTHAIVTIGKFMVIERSGIEEVLKEQSLSLTGVIDASTASKIGKILSLDGVIIGSIHVTDSGIEFISRIIQSEKGLILASADERLKLTAASKNMAKTDDSGNTTDADETGQEETGAVISTSKKVYTDAESITVTYAGLPGNEYDWITLVAADEPDESYGNWFYTQGAGTGSRSFPQVKPGDYEIRVYYNWPDGGYIVQARIKIKVVAH
ncbi:MAG: hypothetical protein JW969_06570 [Spirochaetales bacterium]|nr:hypothetical protein [Spirochaetales bacterium]